jgi:hypothetical protein
MLARTSGITRINTEVEPMILAIGDYKREIQGERRTRDSLGFSLLKRNHQRFITTTLYIAATAFLAWAGPTLYQAKPTQSQREIASHTLNRRW